MQILAISGSLRKGSYNTAALRACNELLPAGMTMRITSIADLPMFDQDVFDAGIPEPAKRLRAEIAQADGVLIASPEYNFSLSGALKNAIDWASRPWGQNSFDHIPAAVIGASAGSIGTALAQQSLRAVLSFCNARQMTAPEAYIQYSTEVFDDDGTILNEGTEAFLTDFMAEFREHIQRVLTVLPRQ
jgi:chromate reductase